MSTPWTHWLPDLLSQVPGCPTVLAKHELRRAAQAFFSASRAWVAALPPIAVAANQIAVTVTFTDPAMELVRIEKAWLDGTRLTVTTVAALDATYSDDWQSHTGAPTHIYQLTPGIVSLYPVPLDAAVTGLKMRVAVKPSDAADGIPDDLAQRFNDAINIGAKARLMLYPNKPWSNLQMGAAYAQAFDSLTGQANVAAAKSYSNGRIAARPAWC